MTAKELKEIVNNIPDDKKIIFTYSGFTFENVYHVETNKRKMHRELDCSREDFILDYPGKNYCMICCTN